MIYRSIHDAPVDLSNGSNFLRSDPWKSSRILLRGVHNASDPGVPHDSKECQFSKLRRRQSTGEVRQEFVATRVQVRFPKTTNCNLQWKICNPILVYPMSELESSIRKEKGQERTCPRRTRGKFRKRRRRPKGRLQTLAPNRTPIPPSKKNHRNSNSVSHNVTCNACETWGELLVNAKVYTESENDACDLTLWRFAYRCSTSASESFERASVSKRIISIGAEMVR